MTFVRISSLHSQGGTSGSSMLLRGSASPAVASSHACCASKMSLLLPKMSSGLKLLNLVGGSIQRSSSCRGRFCLTKATVGLGSVLAGFQGSASAVANTLAGVPPPAYLVYMVAAGFGLPCSEDALVVWAGAGMATGRYGGTFGNLQVAAILYVGVVLSDLVTFSIGIALRRGLFSSLKQRLFSDPAVVDRAEKAVNKWSRAIGAVQRFSLGFRGPLCLVAGFTGVSTARFGAGVAAGAVGTLALQIVAGYLLRNSPNAYIAALALVSGPNLVGHLAGPFLTAVGLWAASRDKRGGSRGSTGEPSAADATG